MSDEAQKIRTDMEKLRREVNEDVEDLVDGARQMTSWRYYVRNYPWACVGGAALIGYFAIPRRLEATKHQQPVAEPARQTKVKSRVTDRLFNFASSLAIRGLVTYAAAKATELLKQRAEKTGAADDPSPHDSQ